MVRSVDARTVKSWLSDGREIAFLDVREHGQYGEGHPFLATSVPYSRLEPALTAMVPNTAARIVLMDDGDGVAERAARRAEALGYAQVNILAGGAPGWRAAGYTLFAGVNVPSKTFGELVELQRHTPRIGAAELQRMTAAGERLVIVDGRPFAEFERMNIPGGICCPNGELALRIGDIVADPETTIVVNCAGRTRSIIGAQTLIDLGVPNRVVALENGTQGWFLAGLELERGARRRHDLALPSPDKRNGPAARAKALAIARGARFVGDGEVRRWLAETDRTTYLLDVRSPEEFAARAAPASVSAPGGQLIQATDQWVGVQGARLVLIDDDGVRAPMVAQWLRQLGHEAHVLEAHFPESGVDAAMGLARSSGLPNSGSTDVQEIDAGTLAASLGKAHIIDLRSSAAYRAGHIEGAAWSIRPLLAAALPADRSKLVVLVSDASRSAALAATDALELGYGHVRLLHGDSKAWVGAGLRLVATPNDPPDAACIDYLFFVHDRHDGNAAAARRYLEWEMGLLAQLDDAERGVFKVGDEVA